MTIIDYGAIADYSKIHARNVQTFSMYLNARY